MLLPPHLVAWHGVELTWINNFGVYVIDLRTTSRRKPSIMPLRILDCDPVNTKLRKEIIRNCTQSWHGEQSLTISCAYGSIARGKDRGCLGNAVLRESQALDMFNID